MRTKRANSGSAGSAAGIVRVGLAALCACAAGCSDPQPPRTFADFLEDSVVMEATLTRCNANREATLNDIECANARRAATTIALRVEQHRRAELEKESERKLAELRAQLVEREQAEREALAAAAAAEAAAYEAQWNTDAAERDSAGAAAAEAPADPAAAPAGLAEHAPLTPAGAGQSPN